MKACRVCNKTEKGEINKDNNNKKPQALIEIARTHICLAMMIIQVDKNIYIMSP